MKKQALQVVLSALLLMSSQPMRAIERSTHISQYGHAAWRLQDGLLNAAPTSLTQSLDGYIWIGTETGLIRFDGARFQQWTPPNWEGISDHTVNVLYTASDGALWIGTPTNLASWKDGVLKVIEVEGAVYVNNIVEDPSHRIWFTTSRRADRKGLCQVAGTTAKCFGPAEGIPGIGGAEALMANTDGTFTLTTAPALLDWSPTKGLLSTYKYAATKPDAYGPNTLLRLTDGSILLGFRTSGAGHGLQRLEGTSQAAYIVPGLDGSALNVERLYTDHRGALWVGTRDDGVYRIVDSSVDHYKKQNSLSGDSVNDFFEDHEGNIWVSTDGGIDCFRDLKAITWASDQGLPASPVRSLLATRDNDVLIATDNVLSVAHEGRISPLPHSAEIPRGIFVGMLQDAAGRFWIGVERELVILDGHRLTLLKRPNGEPIGRVFSLALGSDGSVWALAFDKVPPKQLLHFRDGKMIESVPGSNFGLKVVSDRAGSVWVSGQGRITHYANGKTDLIPLVPEYDPRNFSVQDDLVVSTDGTVFQSSRLGVWIVRDRKARLLSTSDGLPCNDVNGLVFSQQESLWVRSSCGLIELKAAAINSWWLKAQSKVDYRLIDAFDGARSSRAVFFPQMSLAPDGRIWIGNESGVEVIDPTRLPLNSLPPPVHIEGVVADRREFVPAAGLAIGPLTRDLEIHYTALSLTIPQKVKFQYMLEGRDTAWQDPGSRRVAFYNDLKPGHYRFRVIAANNDGVWNTSGDSFDFQVKPAWFQTLWFKSLAVTIILVAIWLAYRIRVDSVSRSIEAQFNERLAERTRVAREFHDTVLQTVQGGKLFVDKVLAGGADESRLRSVLEKLSIWLGQAITEGRSAVYALRASTVEHNELAEYLHKTLKEQCDQTSISPEFMVAGESRHLHPIVRDEVSLIAREAICNACLHSNARELCVELFYGENLRLSIKDTGLGIDPNILNSGKAGHFGLQNMRERSERIHANLIISSSPDSGTHVELRIPGKVAYERDHVNVLQSLKSFFRRS